MFNLEQAMVEWRRQMLDAGVNDPHVLAELEGHLHDEIRQRTQSGANEATAFDAAAQQIGQGTVLKPEFSKIGEPIYERLKHLLCTIAGIPNYQLAVNMNNLNQNLEPSWATYLKSAALIVPAIFVWVGSCIFVVPKLKEICAVSGTLFPKPVILALTLSDFVKNNFILGTLITLTVLILLEWRSRRWPRYRRLVFGVAAFSLNLMALTLITTMMIFAVLAATNLMHGK